MPRPDTASVESTSGGLRGSARERDAERSQLVPSRRQYLDLKAQYPNAILLYRLGDFYETFDDDAHVLARDARIVDVNDETLPKRFSSCQGSSSRS